MGKVERRKKMKIKKIESTRIGKMEFQKCGKRGNTNHDKRIFLFIFIFFRGGGTRLGAQSRVHIKKKPCRHSQSHTEKSKIKEKKSRSNLRFFYIRPLSLSLSCISKYLTSTHSFYFFVSFTESTNGKTFHSSLYMDTHTHISIV